MMRRLTLIMTFLTFVITMSASKDQGLSLSKFSDKRPVVVLLDAEDSRYQFLDKDGVPSGYMVSLLKKLFEEVGVSYRFELLDSFQMHDRILKRDYDLYVGSPSSVKGVFAGKINLVQRHDVKDTKRYIVLNAINPGLIEVLDDKLVEMFNSGEVEYIESKWSNYRKESVFDEDLKIIIAVIVIVLLLILQRVIRYHSHKRISRTKHFTESVEKLCDEVMRLEKMKMMSLNLTSMEWTGEVLDMKKVDERDRDALKANISRISRKEISSFTQVIGYNEGMSNRPKHVYYELTAMLDSTSGKSFVVLSYKNVTDIMKDKIENDEESNRNAAILDSAVMGLAAYDAEGNLLNMTQTLRQLLCDVANQQDVECKRNLYETQIGKYFKLNKENTFYATGIYKTEAGTRCLNIGITKILDDEGAIKYIFLEVLDATEDRNNFLEMQESIMHYKQIHEDIKKHADMLGFLIQDDKRKYDELIDLQHQIQAETEKIKNSDEQKSRFIANMTHEIRTPLNSINGFSQLLATAGKEDRDAFLGIISTNCETLQRLISDIMDLSEIDTGKPILLPHECDWSQIFDRTCRTLSQRVDNKAVSFIVVNPYKSFVTTLDATRMSQILTNFVTNAIKNTDKGHIKVGYETMDEGLYIFCEDTGKGVPKSKQSTIFDRFVKLNDFVQGTGLGLAICKSIAEQCGGKIGVNSEEGQGSTFWVWIPCKYTIQN